MAIRKFGVQVVLYRFMCTLSVAQVVHVVIGAMVPAFGETRVPGIVPGPDPRPLGLGTICPTSRNQRGEALQDKTRGGCVQPVTADPHADLSACFFFFLFCGAKVDTPGMSQG